MSKKSAHKRKSQPTRRTAPGSRKRKTASTPRTRPNRQAHNRKKTTGRGRTSPPTAEVADLAPERLQKILARAGLGSRRNLEARIAAGAIEVNGQVATPGTTVAAGDEVRLENRSWRVAGRVEHHRTLIYNKPEGEVTSRSDPEGRKTVFDNLPRVRDGRWIAVGRLDINTSGLLILTTDGELAHRMMHPAGNVDREYLCRIRGAVSEDQIRQLLDGVELDDGPARFTDIVPGEVTAGHAWYTVALSEGRNREVRRLWEAAGCTVARLKRVRFGAAFLPDKLKTRHYHEIDPADHRVLREDVGLPGKAVGLVLEAKAQKTSKPANQ